MGKYILVTGGELRNKGAQAMVYTTVHEMHKRFPDREVVIISGGDMQRPQEEKDNYRFHITGFQRWRNLWILQSRIFSKIYSWFSRDKQFCSLLEMVQNCDAMLDISGYAYGSNWGVEKAITYLRRVRLGHVWKFPVYLMPQSFGPFAFEGKKSCILKVMAKRILAKAKVIMARETEGRVGLQQNYQLDNVIQSADLVLQSKEIDLNNVFVKTPELVMLDIKPGSVAVIPNAKNNKYGDANQMLKLYMQMIDYLLNNNKCVWLIYHAIEDLAICQKIKEFYAQDERVVLVERELSCLDFGQIVNKFDFVIASRYHSVVHAYKATVPALILGWAIKYRELAALMGQEQYNFDVRFAETHENILGALDCLNRRHRKESACIVVQLNKIQSNNVYDYIVIEQNED